MIESKIISVASSKGGTGKSTITIALAGCLAKDGAKVLIVDSDGQRSVHGLYLRENENGSALFDVESLEARFIFDFLKINRHKYDYIFLDVPRLTDKDESATIQILTLCDFILIPVLSGQFDITSTLDFLNKVIVPISDFKRKNDIEFTYIGFLNKNSRLSDNKQVAPYMLRAGLPFFDTALSDLKVFRDVSVNSSILDTKEGKRRFEVFYNEFKTKITNG